MGKVTTIQVEQTTKKRLGHFKEHERETFDDVIKRLMQVSAWLEKRRRAKHWSSALLSEKSLAKEWLSKEDDDAWKGL